MKPSELLIHARDAIKDIDNWTQQTFARNSSGVPCNVLSGEGKTFCAEGSLIHSQYVTKADEQTYRIANRILDDCSCSLFSVYPPAVNDRGEPAWAHERVMAMYEKAIKTAQVIEAEEREESTQQESGDEPNG